LKQRIFSVKIKTKTAFIIRNPMLKRRNGRDRRKISDRRNGLERRLNFQRPIEVNNVVLTTKEACQYLRISRPTYLKYISMGKIKAIKVGKGWKTLKSELDKFLRGE
jgi:excisionase family DNA binding protein